MSVATLLHAPRNLEISASGWCIRTGCGVSASQAEAAGCGRKFGDQVNHAHKRARYFGDASSSTPQQLSLKIKNLPPFPCTTLAPDLPTPLRSPSTSSCYGSKRAIGRCWFKRGATWIGKQYFVHTTVLRNHGAESPRQRGSERGSGTLTACSHESVLRLAVGLVGPFSRQLLSDCEACRGE